MPYEKWSGKKHKIDHIMVFDSIVHVRNLGRLSKLDDRGKVMVFLGYEKGKKSKMQKEIPKDVARTQKDL